MASQGSSGSVWKWIGCGCAVLGLGAFLLGVAGAWWGFGIARTLGDPAALAEATEEMLGTRGLPEGYEPTLAMPIPFVGDFVLLEAEDHSLVYIEGLRLRRDPQELYDGKVGLIDYLKTSRVHASSHDQIDEGAFDIGPLKANWAAVAGEVDIEGVDAEGDDHEPDGEQLTTLLLLRCSGDRARRGRIAIWTGPESSRTDENGAIDRSGTVADPAAIRAFLGPFDLCGADLE